jgi:hypothetical protein
MNANIFAGIFPTGVIYADKSKEEHGDYKKIAFLPFDTLKLEIFSKRSKLLNEIIEDSKSYIAGEELQISTSGQKIILGTKVFKL